jgi:hypothetical protein
MTTSSVVSGPDVHRLKAQVRPKKKPVFEEDWQLKVWQQ